MTFVREPHPYSLFKRLADDGINISRTSPGIYVLTNNLPFATQVIVTKEIPSGISSWLKCLTNRGTADNLESIIENTRMLNDQNKKHADNIMNIFTTSNMRLVKRKMKEEPAMCQAVNELFADEIKAMKKEMKAKDNQIADKDGQIADQASQIADKDNQLLFKDKQLAAKDALIEKLQAQLEKYAKNEG